MSIANLLAQSAVLQPEELSAQRVNLIATVVAKDLGKQYPELVLDDGTATITARAFDQQELVVNAMVGGVALIIGKPRRYGEEVYVLPEIIRPLADPRWIAVRLRELRQNVPEPRESTPVAEQRTSVEQILSAIKQLDSGNGAELGAVLTTVRAPDAEQQIEQLLIRGEIFQLRPGVVKVLE